MDVLKTILQIVIGLGILNVWLLRFSKPTEWRGGDATNMKEEFATYGLPEGAVLIVGGLKILFAIMLIVGTLLPSLAIPAAAGLAALMLGAVILHFKVGDPPKKSLPAFTLLVMCALVIVL